MNPALLRSPLTSTNNNRGGLLLNYLNRELRPACSRWLIFLTRAECNTANELKLQLQSTSPKSPASPRPLLRPGIEVEALTRTHIQL